MLVEKDITHDFCTPVPDIGRSPNAQTELNGA